MSEATTVEEILRGRYVEATGFYATPEPDTAAQIPVRRMVPTSRTSGVLSLRYAPQWPGLIDDLGGLT